ncbi:MAG: hypothetical protein JJT75_04820 [Opitutales bacterium]|nr:hypothetical protein [Opitutales bacterium]MCH8539859.1 hypothetical protein [Opitutales bacterium]
MIPYTFAYAVILILLGVLLFGSSDERSMTALIPAFFGIAALVAGILAVAKPDFRKHAMHVAALVALIGSAPLIMGLVRVLRNDLATGGMIIMGIISIAFLVLCVRSFINARKAAKYQPKSEKGTDTEPKQS